MALTNLKQMVDKQVNRVIAEGQRFARFDQLRQRHFWSTQLFAYGAGNEIQAGPYEIFKTIPSGTGQGYPANVPLTLLETNWKNSGRVPDNQNFVVSEVGVSLTRPQPVNTGEGGVIPTTSIYANLLAGIQVLVNPNAPIHPQDAYNILYGGILEMQYLTNSIPMGLLADFSQSAGIYVQEQLVNSGGRLATTQTMGDPTNGVPAAAFRRKLEVPILLQHGEAMGMVVRFPRNVSTLTLAQGGCGWAQVRVDWWATESFVEKS